MSKHSIYSVSEINKYISNMFYGDYLLRQVFIKGEISNCTYHSSGHIYFSIKDSQSLMRGIMFAQDRNGLSFTMKEGDQVVVSGSVNSYIKTGEYRIYAKTIQKQGAGEWYEKFEQLKLELEEMGMFDPMYKMPIPKYAKKIGIVTSQTGAAIRDIQNITSRRNPFVQLILYPALVQGQGAAKSIVNGIMAMEELAPDVIIVGRGGGSIEELWAFNEKIVAEAIFNCKIPIISAVGHETDTTISDYVADLRAPTPSAAAELAVFDYRQFVESLSQYQERLSQMADSKFQYVTMKLNAYEAKIKQYHPKQLIMLKKQLEADYSTKLDYFMEQSLKEAKHKLQIFSQRFDGQSPMKKLTKGYSFVTDKSGKMVNDIGQIHLDDELHIRMTNGDVTACVTNIEEV